MENLSPHFEQGCCRRSDCSHPSTEPHGKSRAPRITRFGSEFVMRTPLSSPVSGPAKGSARIFVRAGAWFRSISTARSPCRASEGLRAGRARRAQTPQVVGRRLPMLMPRRPVQAGRAQRLAAPLLQSRHRWAPHGHGSRPGAGCVALDRQTAAYPPAPCAG